MYNLSEKVKIEFIGDERLGFDRKTLSHFCRSALIGINSMTNLLNQPYGSNLLAACIFPKKQRTFWTNYFNSKDYDVILATATFGLRLAIIAPFLKAKTIGWQHSTYNGYLHVKGILFWHQEELLKTYLSNLDRYVVLNSYDQIEFQEKLKISCTVRNNPSSFRSDKKSNCDQKKFIAVGRFAYVKGYDMLMDAFAKYAKKEKEWTLDLLGEGELFDEIVSLAKEKGISDRVHFIGYTKVPEKYYLNASVLLFPSRWEGWGMSIVEAFEYGVPAIAFNIHPLDLLIKNDKTGILVEPYDTDQFADAMLQLASDENKRKTMAAEAIKIADKYDVSKIADEWIQMFQEMGIHPDESANNS